MRAFRRFPWLAAWIVVAASLSPAWAEGAPKVVIIGFALLDVAVSAEVYEKACLEWGVPLFDQDVIGEDLSLDLCRLDAVIRLKLDEE